MKKLLIIFTVLATFLLVACNKPAIHNVTFDVNGGNETIASQSVKHNELATDPGDPTKDDHTFITWELGGEPFKFTTKITKNINLVAKYKENVVIIEQVTVTFDLNNGSQTVSSKIDKGTKVTKPENPTKENYDFIEWQLNDVTFDFNTLIELDITLKAFYKEKEEVNYVERLNYSLDFGNANKTGYDTTSISFTNTGDSKSYTFNKQRAQIFLQPSSDSHVFVLGPISGKTTSYLELDYRTFRPSKIEFTLSGWNKTAIDNIKTQSNAEMFLEKNVNNSWVKMKDIDGTENIVSYIDHDVSKSVTYLLDDSTIYRINYTNIQANATNTGQAIAIDNLNFYSLEPLLGGKLNVSFDEGYPDADVSNVEVNYGEKVGLPEVPVRNYYKFLGWFDGETKYDFNSPLVGDLVLVAMWERSIHLITFDLGHLEVENITIQELPIDDILTSPTPPTRDGYEFKGWFRTEYSRDNLNEFVFGTKLTEDIRLIAGWNKIKVDPVYVRDDSNLQTYYNELSGLTGEALVLKLRTILTETQTPRNYDAVRDALEFADMHPYEEGKVLTIYDRNVADGPWNPMRQWDREHVWPNSKLGVGTAGSTPNQATDMHNLRAINSSVNSRRSNKFFTNTTYDTTIGHLVGDYGYYPGNEDIGDVSRIFLYMAVRYEVLHLTNDQTLLKSTAGTGEDRLPYAYMGELRVLYEWHLKDPVDQFEIDRNNEIFERQGNRNPFIDHPELFEEVFEYFVEIDSERTVDNTFVIEEVQMVINYYEFIDNRRYNF